MIYLLIGPDDFSKREFIRDLAAKHKLEVERVEEITPAALQHLNEPSLFAPAKIFVLPGALASVDMDKELDGWSKSANHIVLVEEKLDKRKSSSQALLKDKRITVKEFPIPEGKDLEKWIAAHLAALGGEIKPDALRSLTEYIAGKESEKTFSSSVVYNLWQVHNEIEKLLQFSDGLPITAEAVAALVPKNDEVEVWNIVNALGDRQIAKTQGYLERFFSTADGGDEKGKMIQLNALLAEQFRNIVLLHSALETRMQDVDILKLTGWKSGRLFVLKKISGKFRPAQAQEFLKKLENLDLEMKTGSVPPRVILDLIIAQV
jgi:DNA polymerase III delta subunit